MVPDLKVKYEKSSSGVKIAQKEPEAKIQEDVNIVRTHCIFEVLHHHPSSGEILAPEEKDTASDIHQVSSSQKV